MQLILNTALATQYKSPSQRIRVITENWVGSQIFCPSCGGDIEDYERNRPVADFYCPNCEEDFELKSQKNNIGRKIVDGAYKTMIERLQSSNNPNFFMLNYDLNNYEVLNFFVIPNYFFVPQIIERRTPLSDNARRAGWVGCNILLQSIPLSGKIFYVKNKKIEDKESVLKNWDKTLFLRESKKADFKGWTLDVMNCIDKLNKEEFSLQEVYNFEEELRNKHPKNKYIKDKIRQQLQFLRDKEYLEFLGRGKYKKL